MAQMKISLGMEDVERMIGGSDEASIEVRNYIVQEFTRRHLRALINDDLMQKTQFLLAKATEEEVKKIVGTYDHYASPKVKLNPEIAKHLEEAVKAQALHLITTAVEFQWEKTIKPTLAELIQSRIEGLTKRYVDARVDERLKQIVKAAAA